MKSSQYVLRVAAAFSAACAASSINQASADVPPEPLAGAVKALTVKFEIKNPKTETDAQFIAVRQMLSEIDAETSGVAEDHPMRDVDCGVCHVNDKISKDHFDTVINEAAPEKSCGKAGCHDLVTAAKMPFWVTPYVSMDKPGKFSRVAELLNHAEMVGAGWSSRSSGLPAFDEAKVNVEVLDRGIYRAKEDPIPFFHAVQSDVLGEKVVNRVAGPVFGQVNGIGVPTSLELVVEAKVRHSGNLQKNLAFADRLPSEILGLIKESKIELKYKPGVLPAGAADLAAAEVASRFPAAVLKTDTGLKKEWEMAATEENPKKATIKVEIKTGEGFENKESKIEIKNIAGSLRSSAFEMLARVQDAYPEVENEFAKYELVFEALSAADKVALVQSGDKLKQLLPLSGDVKWSWKNKANDNGTVPAETELTAVAASLAAAHPSLVRKLKHEIKLKGDLSFKELVTEVIHAAPPRVGVSARQASVSEGGGEKIVFTVSRESETAIDQPLAVNLALEGTAAAGRDYVKPKLRVTLPKGVASVDIPVKVRNDRLSEADETVVFAIVAKDSYVVSPAGSATAAIVDDD